MDKTVARVSWHSVRHNMSWVSTSPRTQPPPWTNRTAASPALPAPAGKYLRTRIGPAGPGMAMSVASPMWGAVISVLDSVRAYSSRASSGERVHSGVAVAEDAQYSSASVSRSSCKLGDALPTPLTHHRSLGIAREPRIPIHEQRSHDVAPKRRGERDEGHGLIAIGQSRRILLGVQLPERLGCEHMMVGVTRQIVMHNIGDRSIAIPAVMRPDQRIFGPYQPIMLHVVDQLVKRAPDQTGEEEDQHAIPAGEDPGESKDGQRRKMRHDQFVSPRIRRKALAL